MEPSTPAAKTGAREGVKMNPGAKERSHGLEVERLGEHFRFRIAGQIAEMFERRGERENFLVLREIAGARRHLDAVPRHQIAR